MDEDAAAALIASYADASRRGIIDTLADLEYPTVMTWREQTPTLHPAQTGAGR